MRNPVLAAALALSFALSSRGAVADEGLTTLVCRDRDNPRVGATLVFNLARKRLIDSSGTGGTILFGDGSLPLKMSPAAIEWEAGGNTFWLDRATLELDVINRVFLCQVAKNHI